MKRFSFLSMILLILLSLTTSKFLSKSFFADNIKKISSTILKKFLANKDFYVIDTRDMTIIAEGYFPKSIILPTSLFSWMSAVIPDGANIIHYLNNSNNRRKERKNNFSKIK